MCQQFLISAEEHLEFFRGEGLIFLHLDTTKKLEKIFKISRKSFPPQRENFFNLLRFFEKSEPPKFFRSIQKISTAPL